ncbi:MAG: hypothetical protein ACRDAG_12810, partial [Cetobacterium somerae]|uniref:hypothetical protein n=1 Tax=Cetobacterium somerae TaxID=188913 RepID=UPI003F40EA96
MNQNYILNVDSDFFPEPEEQIMNSIFKQYEKVIVESLITSFGLDFIIRDQHGGDVDTIHNVRQIGKDEKMIYKNNQNKEDYNNNGEYNSYEYHHHPDYVKKNKDIKNKKIKGELKDNYTGKNIASDEKSDLDHVVSAKEIHGDRGRVLAGLNGADLANSDSNLQATTPGINRSKKADCMNAYIDKNKNKLTQQEKDKMKRADEESRKEYNVKITKEYYTSKKFAKDVGVAAGKVGIKMGARQVLGFIFSEIWFAVKEEFYNYSEEFEFENFLKSIGNSIKKGFQRAKEKYKELISKALDGALAGVLSSLTTTLCNIFFTTAKNVVKIIRQTYASLVQAIKILFINPDNLHFGERMRAVVKILAAGASVILGSLISEVIGKTSIAGIPIIGEIIQNFCGVLTTGILSCSLLYLLDRNESINKLVSFLNNLIPF